ncbi:MAG: peptidoglycan-binding domain-containing protein [Minisyncoccia bacterium]
MTNTKVLSSQFSNRFFISVGLLAFAAVSIPALAYADILNRELQLGMSGSDVSSLQAFLALDNTIYPQGLVTGYFGSLTKSAVSNFQVRNGIPGVGRVGPATLPVLNFQMAGGAGGTVNMGGIAPSISGANVSVSRNTAMVNWNTNQNAKGVVYYSTNALTTYERERSVDVSGLMAMTDSNFRTAQNVAILNLQPNTTYYYMVYTTNQSGDVSVTVPSTFQTSN